jgi:AP-2 complex subunit alpha
MRPAALHLGILNGVISLLTGIVAHDYRGYEACIPKVCAVMQRLARNKDIPQDYLYYGLPSPWLQVKCMRALQYFPTPEDPEYRAAETDVIHQILTGTDMVKNVNKNNALHAVLFEAVALATMLDLSDKTLLGESVATLGAFIQMKEPNIVYLGLEHLTKVGLYKLQHG